MKKAPFFLLQTGLGFLLVCLVSFPLLAQQKPLDKGEVRIKIIERDGGKVRETNRTYRLNSTDDRDKLATKLVDSLRAAHPNERSQQITIIIDEGEGNRVRQRYNDGDLYARRPYDMPRWEYDLRTGIDSVSGKVDRFFRYDFEPGLNRVFDNWSRSYNGNNKPSSIRGLDVFPNNPDKDQLNIRFTAPAKGDVTIVVTTAGGREVSRRQLKDFSGEFVGQLDLGRKEAAGVYFVTVTQREDGAVRRVVVD